MLFGADMFKKLFEINNNNNEQGNNLACEFGLGNNNNPEAERQPEKAFSNIKLNNIIDVHRRRMVFLV